MSELLGSVEKSRLLAQNQIAFEQKKFAEQYFTPPHVAELMANMLSADGSDINFLDPCCGVGNLAAAVYQRYQGYDGSVHGTLVEKDRYLYALGAQNFNGLQQFSIVNEDFFDIYESFGLFNRIILNPPYSKIKSGSKVWRFCGDRFSYSETNLYSAFIASCVSLLSADGELVAIVPRSFCSGPHFRGFREYILKKSYIVEICSFDSRKIFWESKVVQEVVIIKLARTKPLLIKVSNVSAAGDVSSFTVSAEVIVFSGDPSSVIHIPNAENDNELLRCVSKFAINLGLLGCKASTGKVVDFRNLEYLRSRKSVSSVPLVYQDAVVSGHYVNLEIKGQSKPRYLQLTEATRSLVICRGNYVLVRRISFKESPRRIIASPLLAKNFGFRTHVAIDNHLNYIWMPAGEMTESVCVALCAYLSTQTVDSYIRRFSGHTQINAADLNSLPVPSFYELEFFYGLYLGMTLSELAVKAEEYFFT